MASDESEITATIIMNDPVIDRFRKRLLATNLLKITNRMDYYYERTRQFYHRGITAPDRKMAQTLDFYQQAMLNDFIRRRVEKMKESPELRKMKREKKELKKMKREKEEHEKKKRAETTLVDGDETPFKKLKLVQVGDNHAKEESMNLEAASSDLQRQGVPHVGNLMAEGIKVCTRKAEKKNEHVDQSKDM